MGARRSTASDAPRTPLPATDLQPGQTIMPWKGVELDPATGPSEPGSPLIIQRRGGACGVGWPFGLAAMDVRDPLARAERSEVTRRPRW